MSYFNCFSRLLYCDKPFCSIIIRPKMHVTTICTDSVYTWLKFYPSWFSQKIHIQWHKKFFFFCIHRASAHTTTKACIVRRYQQYTLHKHTVWVKRPTAHVCSKTKWGGPVALTLCWTFWDQYGLVANGNVADVTCLQSVVSRCAWSSGRTLGSGFETRCMQVWGTFILCLIARWPVRLS